MYQSEQSPAVSPHLLADLVEGQPARISAIRGGRQMERRLLSLGLRVGTAVNVVQRRGQGVVVASAGNRIALGLGVAEMLMVAPLG